MSHPSLIYEDKDENSFASSSYMREVDAFLAEHHEEI